MATLRATMVAHTSFFDTMLHPWHHTIREHKEVAHNPRPAHKENYRAGFLFPSQEKIMAFLPRGGVTPRQGSLVWGLDPGATPPPHEDRAQRLAKRVSAGNEAVHTAVKRWLNGHPHLPSAIWMMQKALNERRVGALFVHQINKV